MNNSSLSDTCVALWAQTERNTRELEMWVAFFQGWHNCWVAKKYGKNTVKDVYHFFTVFLRDPRYLPTLFFVLFVTCPPGLLAHGGTHGTDGFLRVVRATPGARANVPVQRYRQFRQECCNSRQGNPCFCGGGVSWIRVQWNAPTRGIFQG